MKKRVLCLFCAALLFITLFGCSTEQPEKPQDEQPSGDVGKHNSENEQKASLDKTAFTYEKLSITEELAGADHLYQCYQNETHALFSVCSNLEEAAPEGQLQKTVNLTLYSLSDGSVISYPVQTDAYVLSALPYKSGILYADYVYTDEAVKWSIIFTDGNTKAELDNGSVSSSDDVPKLLYLGEVPHYLVKDEAGYSVKIIDGDKAVVSYSQSGCELFGINNAVSNEKQLCYLVKYPNDEFSTFCVADKDGVLYSHKLNGKITSYTITDKYAVCGTGIEETKKHSLEVIDLATGETKIVPHIYDAFYCLSGVENVLVAVNGGNWENLMALDIEDAVPFAISSPETVSEIQTILFKSAGENSLFTFVYSSDGYEFYLLNIKR